jgi:hypothetical protein
MFHTVADKADSVYNLVALLVSYIQQHRRI